MEGTMSTDDRSIGATYQCPDGEEGEALFRVPCGQALFSLSRRSVG